MKQIRCSFSAGRALFLQPPAELRAKKTEKRSGQAAEHAQSRNAPAHVRATSGYRRSQLRMLRSLLRSLGTSFIPQLRRGL